MSEATRKSINDWNRIEPVSDTVLAPQISAIYFRRVMVEATKREQCGDVCPNDADVVLKEIPVSLTTREGKKIILPRDTDSEHLEAALADLKLSPEQIRYLENCRRRLALCLGCARRRILDK